MLKNWIHRVAYCMVSRGIIFKTFSKRKVFGGPYIFLGVLAVQELFLSALHSKFGYLVVHITDKQFLNGMNLGTKIHESISQCGFLQVILVHKSMINLSRMQYPLRTTMLSVLLLSLNRLFECAVLVILFRSASFSCP